MPFSHPAFGVNLDEVEGDLLDPGFGLLLEFFPSGRTQFKELRRGAVLAVVLAYFMQGVDAYIKNVPVSVNELDGLLFLAFHFDLLQSSKLSDSVVNMGDIVAHFEFVQLFEGDGLLLGVAVFQVELVVALKELVVCVERNTGIGIQKTGIEWTHQSAVRNFPFSFFKDIGQTLSLLSGCTTDGVFQAFFLVLDQFGPQKIKTLI